MQGTKVCESAVAWWFVGVSGRFGLLSSQAHSKSAPA